MSQTDSNFNAFDFKSHTDQMLAGLNGMVSQLDFTVKEAFKNMGPEHAQAFAKAMSENNVPSKIEEIQKAMKEIKNEFKDLK